MKAVIVEGTSMRPYLISGDILIVDQVQDPIPFGSLVLVKNIHGESLLHRYLGNRKVKGDRCKYWDEISNIESLVVGKVNSSHKVEMNSKGKRFFFGALSFFNQKSFFMIHHAAAGLIELSGRLLREK